MLFDSFKELEVIYNIEKIEIISLLLEVIKEELNLKYDVFLELDENNSKIHFLENNVNNTQRSFRITKSRYKQIKKELKNKLHYYSVLKQNIYFKEKILNNVLVGEVISKYKGGYLIKTAYGTCKLPYNQIPLEKLKYPLEKHKKMYFYVYKIVNYKNIKNEIFLQNHNKKIVKHILNENIDKKNLAKIIYKNKDSEILVLLKNDISNIEKSIIINDLINYKINFSLIKNKA